MLFSGSFQCVPDSNGRICLPKSFRNELPAPNSTIYLLPKHPFWIAYPYQTLYEKLRQMAAETENETELRNERRRLMVTVTPVHVDPQGRITLPWSLKKTVSDAVTLVGTGLDFEIWPVETWDATIQKGELR